MALAEKKEVPPRFHLYQGEMGSGPSLGNVCFQVSFESALLPTSLESCVFCFISTFGLSSGTNFSFYYRSNRCSLWTIVAQSYKFYCLYCRLSRKACCGPYTTYVHHAYCVQPCPLESSTGGLALNLVRAGTKLFHSLWVQWLYYLNDKVQSIFCLKTVAGENRVAKSLLDSSLHA